MNKDFDFDRLLRENVDVSKIEEISKELGCDCQSLYLGIEEAVNTFVMHSDKYKGFSMFGDTTEFRGSFSYYDGKFDGKKPDAQIHITIVVPPSRWWDSFIVIDKFCSDLSQKSFVYCLFDVSPSDIAIQHYVEQKSVFMFSQPYDKVKSSVGLVEYFDFENRLKSIQRTILGCMAKSEFVGYNGFALSLENATDETRCYTLCFDKWDDYMGYLRFFADNLVKKIGDKEFFKILSNVLHSVAGSQEITHTKKYGVGCVRIGNAIVLQGCSRFIEEMAKACVIPYDLFADELSRLSSNSDFSVIISDNLCLNL